MIFSLVASGYSSFAQTRESSDKEKSESEVNSKQNTPVKIIEYLPGSWVIEKVHRGKDDVTLTDTLAGNESFEFNREGRFISYAGNEKIDSGAYRVNEQHAILYVASEREDDKVVEWTVSFPAPGTMTMKLKDDGSNEESFTYTYRKNGIETSSNREE